MIRLSVIVPIYNAAEYLSRCLNSILEQTYRNLEVILVDDGSLDDSLNICRQYQKQDHRIKIIHRENGGQAAARESGIKEATGDYITFVDADDYIDRETYEHIISFMNHNRSDIVAYALTEVYPDKEVIKKNHFEEGFYTHERMEQIYESMLSYGEFFDFGILPNLCCKLIKNSFLRETCVNVSKNIRVGEDADLVYQLMVQADSLQIIDYSPYRYCKRNDSMLWKNAEYAAIISLETDLRNAFTSAGVWNIMEKQLQDYITFLTLLKHPSKILDCRIPFSEKTKKIALYGAGGMGQAIWNQMNANVVVWVDRDYQRYEEHGLMVEAPEKLTDLQNEYDVVYIAILNMELCKSIKTGLENAGITKEICYYER